MLGFSVVVVIEAREDDKGSSHSTGTSLVSTCAGNPEMAPVQYRGQPSGRIPDLRICWDVAARMPSPAICDTRLVSMITSGKAGFGKCAYGYDHRHTSS